MSHRLMLTTLVFALCAGSAMAQDVRLYRHSERVDPQEVARILDRSKPQQPAIKMRSIRLLDEPASAAPTASETQGESAPRPRATALALPVQFAFDSTDILPAARPQLDALAEGIRLLPELQKVVIEGHTDASGPDHYNEMLSQRRAYMVKRYLVAMHGVDPTRLKAVGLGKYAPLPGRDPYAGENRRVQFRGE